MLVTMSLNRTHLSSTETPQDPYQRASQHTRGPGPARSLKCHWRETEGGNKWLLEWNMAAFPSFTQFALSNTRKSPGQEMALAGEGDTESKAGGHWKENNSTQSVQRGHNAIPLLLHLSPSPSMPEVCWIASNPQGTELHQPHKVPKIMLRQVPVLALTARTEAASSETPKCPMCRGAEATVPTALLTCG